MSLLRTYLIKTERVILRCYEPTDAYEMSETILRNHHHLFPWMPWAVKDRHTETFCAELIRTFRGNYDLGVDYPMAVFDAHTGKYIGGAGLHTRVGADAFEIGYWMDQVHARMGFGKHVAAALTKVGFEYEGVHRMVIKTQVGNVASERIAFGLNYKLEGTLRGQYPKGDDEYADIYYFAMLREDFESSAFKWMHLKAYGFDGRELEAV